ncbi:interferon phi 1 isoform X2 [Oryzias latipes]
MVCRSSPLVLLAILTPVLCCDWLRDYRHLRNRTVVLLETMGGQTTTQDPAVAFPYNLYKQVSSRGVQVRLWFIRENLQHIHDLYDHIQRSYAGWNQLKMVEFMQSVERQIQELNSCLKEPNVATESRKLGKKLSKYYCRLRRKSLQPSGTEAPHQPGSDPGSGILLQGGSAVGWELLRQETLKHLNRIDRLSNHPSQ